MNIVSIKAEYEVSGCWNKTTATCEFEDGTDREMVIEMRADDVVDSKQQLDPVILTGLDLLEVVQVSKMAELEGEIARINAMAAAVDEVRDLHVQKFLPGLQ